MALPLAGQWRCSNGGDRALSSLELRTCHATVAYATSGEVCRRRRHLSGLGRKTAERYRGFRSLNLPRPSESGPEVGPTTPVLPANGTRAALTPARG